jgi:hypothetical protein
MRASLPLRAVLVALLVASLAVPSFAAASGSAASVRTPAATASAGAGAVAQVWSWVRSIWIAAGCGIDSSGGRCGAGAVTAPSARPDAGCVIDPSGGCRASAIVPGS